MVAGQQNLRSGISEAGSPRSELWLRTIAIVLAVAFPIQALLASEALYKGNADMRTAHEQLGNLLFLLAIGQLVLAFMAQKSGFMDMRGVVLRAAFLVLVIAQFALGYAGRENIDVRIWHMPNGVLLMGLAAAIAAMSYRRNQA